MDERSQRGVRARLAIALLLGAAWLLYAGASYLSAWMTYEAERPPAVTCVFCPALIARLRPSPAIVAFSYLVAIPTFLGIAWWFRRGHTTRLRLAGSDGLIGAMAWMALLLALGTVWPSLLFASVVWSLFLVSILGVPPVVAFVGAAFLWDGRRRPRGIPPRASGQ